ncbi:hypothetical protein Salat_1446800 [Sesamum alatum]|uniref:Uncharacterized protein n=1 Tax=Sesamum alatum TaxID=300844 RepID=A0AAE1YBI4_9LAMI|nr:hypothetical protein Salat_1446800 [Sesamum alatum]
MPTVPVTDSVPADAADVLPPPSQLTFSPLTSVQDHAQSTLPDQLVMREDGAQETSPSDVAEPSHEHLPSPARPSLRRSARAHCKPGWMNAFVCNTASDSTLMLSADFVACLANNPSLQEPRTYAEVSQTQEWNHAMEEELLALEKNETWELETHQQLQETHLRFVNK